MVAIFPNVFLWRRSYSQNWEVLTLKNIASSHLHMPVRPTLLHRMHVWPSFLFYCFVKIWATCENFLGKWFTAPPWQKIARTPMFDCNLFAPWITWRFLYPIELKTRAMMAGKRAESWPQLSYLSCRSDTGRAGLFYFRSPSKSVEWGECCRVVHG